MVQAIRDIQPSAEVLRWPDDLSCGPIETNLASARAAWWKDQKEDWNLEIALNEFWDRVFNFQDKIVVWFARHSANELAFYLNWTDRIGERQYEIIDPTGEQFPSVSRDGSAVITEPTKAVSRLAPGVLASLLGTERGLSATEKEQARSRWRQLKAENAPFRIVTKDGLVSADSNYFDGLLLKEATEDWQRMARLIGCTMSKNDDPYFQVGDRMLQSRVINLIKNGMLLAEGDPWDMRYCRVRLART